MQKNANANFSILKTVLFIVQAMLIFVLTKGSMVSMTATHKYVSNEELFFMLKLSIKYLPGSIGSTDGNLHSWLTNQKGVKASFTALLLIYTLYQNKQKC